MLSQGEGEVRPDVVALFAQLAAYRSIGLAVSGGPDSLGLMLLVDAWRKAIEAAPGVIVYTVDHGLRPEAAEEAAMVVREASRLGLLVRALRWDGDKPRSGLQAAARAARYRLIGAAMQEDGAEVLVTAHHAQDQAETVLMRLAHGSGVTGLAGMRPLARVEGVLVARPLLGVDPDVLRAVVAEAGMAAAADPSNDDEDYERVRWRRLLPRLGRLGLTMERLGRLAERMQEVDAVLAEHAAAAFSDTVRMAGGVEAAVDHVKFMSLNRTIALRVLGQALGEVGDWAKPHALGQFEALYDQLRQGRLRPTTLHGCVVDSDGTTITVRHEAGRQRPAGQQRLKEDAH